MAETPQQFLVISCPDREISMGIHCAGPSSLTTFGLSEVSDTKKPLEYLVSLLQHLSAPRSRGKSRKPNGPRGSKGGVGTYHEASGLNANLHLLVLHVLSATSLATEYPGAHSRPARTQGRCDFNRESGSCCSSGLGVGGRRWIPGWVEMFMLGGQVVPGYRCRCVVWNAVSLSIHSDIVS